MANSITSDYCRVNPNMYTNEATAAYEQVQKSTLEEAQKKLHVAEKAGAYAQSIAPFVAAQAIAFLALSYLRVFSVLSFLNCNMTSYAVPALVSAGATKLADRVEPIQEAIASTAGRVTKAAVTGYQLATMPMQQRTLVGGYSQILTAIC
jgi:hypothetical protein